jgi:hypothetical protein
MLGKLNWQGDLSPRMLEMDSEHQDPPLWCPSKAVGVRSPAGGASTCQRFRNITAMRNTFSS